MAAAVGWLLSSKTSYLYIICANTVSAICEMQFAKNILTSDVHFCYCFFLVMQNAIKLPVAFESKKQTSIIHNNLLWIVVMV
jgi:hypothetical protein